MEHDVTKITSIEMEHVNKQGITLDRDTPRKTRFGYGYGGFLEPCHYL